MLKQRTSAMSMLPKRVSCLRPTLTRCALLIAPSSAVTGSQPSETSKAIYQERLIWPSKLFRQETLIRKSKKSHRMVGERIRNGSSTESTQTHSDHLPIHD